MTLLDKILLTLDTIRFCVLNIIKNWNFIYDTYIPMIFDFLFK